MRIYRSPGAVTLLITLSLLQPSDALAVDRPLLGASQPTITDPKPPPPQIDSSWQKEGARLIGKRKTTWRRHVPPQSHNRRGQHGGTQRPAQTPISRYNLPVDEELVDFRLNDGICGPVRPDGTRAGPSRCRYWNIPPQRSEQNFEQTVNQVQQQIRTQMASVAFPRLTVKIQPRGRTLVNADTIVYTDETTLTRRTVMLLGYPVAIEGRPVKYTWHFGDGSPAASTTSPGKPYPSKEITHRYLKHGTAQVSVTAHYSARFNVAGAGWQDLEGTVPVTGPPTTLLIREGIPVLVDPSR